MKRTKKSLWMSILSLLLCFSMLLGTTYAWFTDSVATAGNRIVSGSLKVDLLHSTVDAQAGASEWVSLKDNPDHKIFDYSLWEPGYTRFEKLKIENLGNLALKYQLSTQVVTGTETIGANGERLSDVIDVYLYDGDSTAASFTDVKTNGEWILAGTLTEMLGAADGFARGNILREGAVPSANAHVGSHTVSIALHMREEAGNEYQDLSIGDLHVTLVATQLTNEYDSFGNQYDKNAVFPSAKLNYSINATVTLNNDNTTASEVSLGGTEDSIKATLPAGTKLEEGTTYVTLSVTELINTNSNITVEEDQQSRSVDVHVSGVADDNATPIIVTINGLMPAGYNMGSFTLYHIENGAPVEMTWVAPSQLDAHNEFSYDAATGNVRMALCSFSEVAIVADCHSEWNGGTDVSWYTDAKSITKDGKTYAPGNINNPYIIACADQLNGFGQIVGGMAVNAEGEAIKRDDFDGRYVKLIYDIDLGTKEGHTKMYEGDDPYRQGKALVFYPIGYYFTDDNNNDGVKDDHYSTVYSFGGNFNGNGHTVSNFYQNTWEMIGDNEYYPVSEHRYRDGMGLFGYVYDGEVKNLTVDNFSSDGEYTPTGVIAAYAHAATFINISITNCNPRVYNTGNGGIVGIGGSTTKVLSDTNRKAIRFENITVDQTNKITALWGSWDVSCSGIMGMLRGPDNVDDWMRVELVNCHVAAQIDAYNDVCGNYQYYWYRYSGMMVGSIRTHVTNANGYTVPDTSMITAENCTVHFGDWNNYYYCELVANSLASYTHDHQFSRLTMVKSVDAANMKYVDLDGDEHDIPAEGRYNFAVMKPGVTEHGDDSVDCFHFVNGAVWNHEQGGYETFDLNGDGLLNDLKEDRQHYYLPFNKQLFQGYGWGVKNIPLGEFDGITVLDTTEGYSVEKFKGREDVDFIAIGYTFLLGDLFRESGETRIGIKSDKVKVTLTMKGITDDISNHFSMTVNEEDWTKTRLRLQSVGTYQITIQDYYYCTATTITVQAGWYHHAASGIDTVFLMNESANNNPSANYPTHAYSMTQAYQKLAELNATSGKKGGNIVIMGNYTQDALFRAPEHEGTVTIKSIDDISTYWVEERDPSNDIGVRYFCGGPTVFDNIRIEATEANSDRLSWNVVGNFHDLTIGENIIMDKKGNDFILVLGAQGGGEFGGASTIKVQDATLTVNGGEWSEVVGSVRTSFNSQSKPNYNDSHIAEFANTDYHLDINIGGNAVIDKLFAHSRGMEEEALRDANGTLYRTDVSEHASCTVSLLGGKSNAWCVKDQMINVDMGYVRGYTTYIGKNFDLDASFNAVADDYQDAENYSQGYYKHIGISGESVFEYIPGLDTVGTGTTVPATNESYLIVEPTSDPDRINTIKDSGKVRLDTFKYIGYGAPVRPVPETLITDEYYVGWTGTGDGKTPETFMNSIGWKTGIILDMPTNDEGGYDEGTDDDEPTVVTASEKYPEDRHLWYYFDNYGGTYVAVQKMYLGGATAIKNAPTPITLTAVDKNGYDYRQNGAEYGYFIMKAAPIGYLADGTTLKTVDPYYLRVINSEVIFENITIYSRAGHEMHPDNNYGIVNITDSQNFYFLIDKGGRVVIRDNVTFAHKVAEEQNPYVQIKAGGTLYLEKFGFSSYTGEGTIVLSDALINSIYNDPTAYEADIALLNDFVAFGGKISDEHGIFLRFNNDLVLADREGRVPSIAAGETEIEYSRTVYVDQTNGNDANSGIDPIDAVKTLEEAYSKFRTDGGTIVINGTYTLSDNFTEPEHVKHITVTGNGTGVIANGGTSKLYYLNGDTTFENLTFESTVDGTGFAIVAQYNKLVLGTNITASGFKYTDLAKSFLVVGGFDINNGGTNSDSKPANITINSCAVTNGKVGVCIVTLDYNDTGANKNHFDANVTINGGTVSRIYGPCNFGTADGAITYTINDGTIGSSTIRGYAVEGGLNIYVNGGTLNSQFYLNAATVKATAHVKNGVAFPGFSGTGTGTIVNVD